MFWKMCTQGIWGWVSIHTADWPLSISLSTSWSMSWLILDLHQTDTHLTSQSTRLTVHRYLMVCLWKLVDTWPTVNWDVDEVLTEYQSRCRSRVERGYGSLVDCRCLSIQNPNVRHVLTPHNDWLLQFSNGSTNYSNLGIKYQTTVLYFECMILIFSL